MRYYRYPEKFAGMLRESGIKTPVNLRNYRFAIHYISANCMGNKGISILDMGSSAGLFVHLLQQNGFWNSYGMDIDEKAIQLGTKLGIKNLIRGDILEAKKTLGREFDLVVCTGVVISDRIFDPHKLPVKEKVRKFLTEACSLLSKGGTLLLRTETRLEALVPMLAESLACLSCLRQEDGTFILKKI